MFCQPRILIDQPVHRPKISVILLDWGVRESFHTLHYLNKQTVPREDYELIWLEFYDREPTGLREMIHQTGRAGRPGVDRWVVMGYPDDVVYHKHRLYNLGILASRGTVCVICDSDAMVLPSFIERIIKEFESTPHGILHFDEVRSLSRDYYPFNYPHIDDVSRTSNNWMGKTTTGIWNLDDRLHNCNIGACLAARREDLLKIGGADEHTDYLGYICGPYDMTFRLTNYHAQQERWIFDEQLYHTWHPNTTGGNRDYQGPSDGRSMSLLALHARASRRIQPFQRSPLMHWSWRLRPPALATMLRYLSKRPEPTWLQSNLPDGSDQVYWGSRDHFGYNLFSYRGNCYALPLAAGQFCPRRYELGQYAEVVQSNDYWQLERMVEARVSHKPVERSGVLKRMWRRMREEQPGSWPAWLWRKIRRTASRLRHKQAPWFKLEKKSAGA